jgi:DNA-binding transcriptional LysR family regulator
MMDWDELRIVLAVARSGSLSGAAKALGVTQPTVGRRLDALEQRLRTRLFERRPTGLTATAATRGLLAHAERMEAEAFAAERSLAARDDGVTGVVRVTGSEWLCVRVLAPAIAPLLARNPGLVIDLVADTRHLNLVRREADLAIRPRAFEQQTVYQRRIGRIELGLYASADYLARTRTETFVDGGTGHAVIAMVDEVGDIARGWLTSHARHARVVARVNGREQMATLAAAGAGLACLPRVLGDALPALRRVATDVALPVRALWLGVHREMRDAPRVRATIDALVAGLS